MSVSIRSCPGCDSLILADTFECPDCGHVFDEEKAGKLKGEKDLATAEMEEPCRECGSSVRAGLVRCPDCGCFMRDDIAKRYEDLQKNPQKIIYSDEPDREDYMPARFGEPSGPVMDAVDEDDAGFELGDGTAIYDAEDGFELGAVGSPSTAPAPQAAPSADTAAQDAATEAARTVDDPREVSGEEKSETPSDDAGSDDAGDKSDSDGESKSDTPSGDSKKPVDADADDLLAIARQDEKETTRRRKQRRRQDKENRVLIPCACGAWIRVRKHQMGKSVRCRKCGNMLIVPQLLKKKGEGDQKKKESVKLAWMKDVDFVPVDPGNLKLKAGSVAANAAPVDVIFSQDGIAICTLVAKSKGGLFSKGNTETPDEKRAAIETFTQAGHSISGVPSAKTVFIPADKVEELLIVQPVKQAHESMFAGVPVFGEGRIAVRVPASGNEKEQLFLSMALTDFRFFAAQLKRLFEVEDFGKDQGVPQDDKKTALKCHYTGMILNALAETEYYEVDPHIELTLLGRKCGACGIAVNEESRKKQKIGGASGRGLSRAKCPKCNGKFGNNSLYTFELKDTAPKFELDEPEEDDDAMPAPSPKSDEKPTDDKPSESEAKSEETTE